MASTTASKKAEPPCHRLMVNDSAAAAALLADQQIRLNPKLRRDYLSQRHYAFESLKKQAPAPGATAQVNQTKKMSSTVKTKREDPLWCGASAAERSLASCCQAAMWDENGNVIVDADDEDGCMFPGALAKEKITEFLGLLAMRKCTREPGSRALALAILERSLEADQTEEAELNGNDTCGTSAVPDAAPSSSSQPPPRKRLRSSPPEDHSEEDKKPAAKEATVKMFSSISRQTKTDQLVLRFLAAGGLRILNQWLVECTTPTKVKSFFQPPSVMPYNSATMQYIGLQASSITLSAPATVEKASPYGPMLLPLLSFLADIPFDQDLVKKSKINKCIRQLSKDIDALVRETAAKEEQQRQQQQAHNAGVVPSLPKSNKTTINEATTDPKTGGLSILKVQEAVNKLKSTWLEKAKSTAVMSQTSPPPYPFASLKQKLKARLVEVQQFELGKGPEPSWMEAAEAAAQKAAAAAAAAKAAATAACPVKKKRHQTKMAELARREREKERQERMKGDIRKVKEERDKLLEKLRKLKHNKQVQEEQKQAALFDPSRKRVKWKDGLGAASGQVKRAELVEVVYFDKHELPVMVSSKKGPASGAEADVAFLPDRMEAPTEENNYS